MNIEQQRAQKMIGNIYPFGDGVTGEIYCGLAIICAPGCF